MIPLACVLLAGVAVLGWAAHRLEVRTDRLQNLSSYADDLRAQLAKVDATAERFRKAARMSAIQVAMERRRASVLERERDEALAAGLVHAGVVRRLRQENAGLAAGLEKLVSRAELEAMADLDRELRELGAGS